MEKKGIMIMSRSEEIQRDSDRLGVYGESAFESAVKYFLPEITGHSEHYIKMNPNEFKIENIADEHINHDFIIYDNESNATRVEVKAIDGSKFKNIVVEFGGNRFSRVTKQCYFHKGWYLKSKAKWYVFVHCSANKAQYQLVLFKAEDLQQCVNSGKYRRQLIQGDQCMLIPITDLKEYDGKYGYLSQMKLLHGELPANAERLAVFEKMEDGTTKVNLHNLFPVHSSMGAIA